MTTENMTKPFDPQPYLIKLKGKDYLPIASRNLWLRTEHPEAIINMDLVQLDLGNGFALFRAEVIIPGGGSAVGYGSETAKDFGDFIEKASTKALGRALAALGYGTQFAQDIDYERLEGDNPRIADAPVAPPRPRAGDERPNTGQDAPKAEEGSVVIGPKWTSGLQKLVKDAGWTDEALLGVLTQYGADSLDKLTLANARLLRKALEEAIAAL